MNRWMRAAAVVALVTGLMATAAEAQTEGDTTADNIYVTLVLRGAAPPGATFEVEVPGAIVEEERLLTFTPSDLGPRLAQETPASTGEFVRVTDSGGAAHVGYGCQASSNASCTVLADRVEYSFGFGFNTQIDVTITLTFGRCGGQPVTTFIGAGDTPTAGNDVILGTAGPNTINGLGGDDRICGGGGNDILRGGSGTDRIFGSNGVDRLEGGLHGDRLFGQNGNDTLLGQDGTDLLDGGANRDTCNGGPGVDQAPRCEVKTAIP